VLSFGVRVRIKVGLRVKIRFTSEMGKLCTCDFKIDQHICRVCQTDKLGNRYKYNRQKKSRCAKCFKRSINDNEENYNFVIINNKIR